MTRVWPAENHLIYRMECGGCQLCAARDAAGRRTVTTRLSPQSRLQVVYLFNLQSADG